MTFDFFDDADSIFPPVGNESIPKQWICHGQESNDDEECHEISKFPRVEADDRSAK
jgi:hypothetical protein